MVPLGGLLYFGISACSRDLERDPDHVVGSITVHRNGWSLSNLTANTTIVVENLEGGAELIKVAPRHLDTMIPFELSRVVVSSADGLMELKVFADPPLFLDGDALAAPAGDQQILDPGSKYFMVLVALCEPRLRLSPMAAIPSVQEVLERLRPARRFQQASRSSINFHIDYLLQHKLPVRQWASSGGGRMHSKREALVFFALRYDLVREEHLRLLPRNRQRG